MENVHTYVMVLMVRVATMGAIYLVVIQYIN